MPAGAFDIVSCIGATWIGNGLVGTLELMRAGLRDRESLLLVGEPYWIDTPPDEAYAAITNGDHDLFTTLAGTEERIAAAGFELVEMVLADHHGWDRYVAAQWMRFQIGSVRILIAQRHLKYVRCMYAPAKSIWPIPGGSWAGVCLCSDCPESAETQ